MNLDKSIQSIELNSFKNEILKMIRITESKLMEQISIRAIELSTKIRALDDRIELFQDDISFMKNLSTDFKLKYEKINDYERFQKKSDATLLTHEIRINRINDQIDNIKSKQEKIILENLTVPGFIGPSCKFRNISDYLSNIIKETSKNKSEKDQMRFDINSIKIKIDVMHKNLITLIDANSNRCNTYTNNKLEMYNNSLGGKFEEINNKVIDIKMRDIQTKIQVEKYVQEIKDYLQEIKNIKDKMETTLIEDKKNKENKKVRNKDRLNSMRIKDNLNTSDINTKYNFNKIEARKERKYSVRIKGIRREKKQEKEETKENLKENLEKEKIEEKTEEKENDINEEKEEEVNKIQTIDEEKEKEKSKNSTIVESSNSRISEINNIKINLQKYNNELNYIKQSITDINLKISDFNSNLNKMKLNLSKNKINNNNIVKKESKKLQTNLDDTNQSSNKNNFTMENFNQNNMLILSENDSDEITRKITNEKIYNNILNKEKNKNYKYRKYFLNMDINNNNNIKFNYYDVVTPLINNNKSIPMFNKRFHSPKNIFNNKEINKETYSDVEKKNDKNYKDLKDIFLKKYKKYQLIKDDSYELKASNLEENILNSIKNLIKENKYIKYKIIQDINDSFTQNTQKEDNNLIESYNQKNKNKNKKERESLSPDVDKLYREYYIKNNKEEKINGNNYNYNNKLIPKKIVPVFGRTSYTPIKKQKNYNSEKSLNDKK